MKKISIIYVYFNSYEVIVNSIHSVLNTFPEKDLEIIIVVNECKSGKVNELAELSNSIKIIYNNSTNKGFSAANNIGAKSASSKYLLILNPDTIVKENTLSELYNLMEERKDVGAAICKLVDENGEIQKTVMRMKYDYWTIIINHFFLHTIPGINKLFKKRYFYKPHYLTEQYPETISGAFMFIRKPVFFEVGMFDENYFMYSEDNDLSLQIGKISKLLYYPYVETIHIGAITFGKTMTVAKYKLYYSSLFYFIEKYYGATRLKLLKILLKINAVVLYPFVPLIKNEQLKIALINRGKVLLQMPLRGRDV